MLKSLNCRLQHIHDTAIRHYKVRCNFVFTSFSSKLVSSAAIKQLVNYHIIGYFVKRCRKYRQSVLREGTDKVQSVPRLVRGSVPVSYIGCSCSY